MSLMVNRIDSVMFPAVPRVCRLVGLERSGLVVAADVFTTVHGNEPFNMPQMTVGELRSLSRRASSARLRSDKSSTKATP